MKRLQICLVMAAMGCLAARQAQAGRDDLFPAAVPAKPFIDFDGHGFMVNGQRQFILSGSIHFSRVPRELWHDRLLQLKRAGFNTVQTYVFWNEHEAVRGQFDFTGDRDLGAFLSAAQDVGLYATVRPGPYVCAEWNSGGYPLWLRDVPGVRVRDDNKPFEEAMKPYFDKVLGIISQHQINHGGNVILVQLENEHPRGWGTQIPNGYFQFLLDEAKSANIEVPDFFSGLHHGNDPGKTPWTTTGRSSPWYSTETWVWWYDKYGSGTSLDAQKEARIMWNMAARGANGFNLYVFHGGTNFDYFNNQEDAASYDYGTLVGQDGDLRQTYYLAKRLAMLTQSFPEVFANSENVDGDYKDFASGDVTVRARKSAAGTMLFLESDPKATAPVATLKDGTTIKMEPQETLALLNDTALDETFRVESSNVRTLAVTHNGPVTTWLTYAPLGDKGKADIVAQGKHFAVNLASSESGPVSVGWSSPDAAVGKSLRVVTLTPEQADRTWIIGAKNAQDVVIGPEYLGDYSDVDGKIAMTIRHTAGKATPKQITILGAKSDAVTLSVDANETRGDAKVAPSLSAPVAASDAYPIADNFDDSKWVAGATPPQMGVDGDQTCYAWYRTTFDAPAAGDVTLSVGNVKDDCRVYLNGVYAGEMHGVAPARARRGQTAPKQEPLTLKLSASTGHNRLVFFVSEHGRDKAYNYIGDLSTLDPKGLAGDITIGSGADAKPVTGWKMHGGITIPTAQQFSGNVGTGNMPRFYRSTFTSAPGAASNHPVYRMTYTGLSRGSVWLNGHNIGRYPEKIPKLDTMYLPECWIKEGANEVLFFDEAGKSPEQVKIVPDAAATYETIEVHS